MNKTAKILLFLSTVILLVWLIIYSVHNGTKDPSTSPYLSFTCTDNGIPGIFMEVEINLEKKTVFVTQIDGSSAMDVEPREKIYELHLIEPDFNLVYNTANKMINSKENSERNTLSANLTFGIEAFYNGDEDEARMILGGNK